MKLLVLLGRTSGHISILHSKKIIKAHMGAAVLHRVTELLLCSQIETDGNRECSVAQASGPIHDLASSLISDGRFSWQQDWMGLNSWTIAKLQSCFIFSCHVFLIGLDGYRDGLQGISGVTSNYKL